MMWHVRRKRWAGMPKLAFCEPVVVVGPSPWCLRYLTDAGPKYGGGVDTPSLCGRVRQGYGWDVDVEVTKDRLENPEVTCQRCQEKLCETTPANLAPSSSASTVSNYKL